MVRGDDDAVHAALSGHLGHPVRLAREQEVPHFDDGPVHLVTTASLRQVERAHGRPVDPVRLRPNLLMDTPGDGFVEDSWVGREVATGSDVVLAVRMRTPRCVMVDLPQPGVTIDGRLLQTSPDLNDTCLGVVADVVRGGTIRIGDVFDARRVAGPAPRRARVWRNTGGACLSCRSDGDQTRSGAGRGRHGARLPRSGGGGR